MKLTPKSKAHITVTYTLPFGFTLDEAVGLYGEDVIYRLAAECFRTKALNCGRTMLDKGVPGEEVVEHMQNVWRPFKRFRRTVKVEDVGLDVLKEFFGPEFGKDQITEEENKK